MKAIVKFAIEKAAQGVEYSPKYGAICPFCGAIKIPAATTRKWEEKTRVRYHKCNNAGCPLCFRNISIKSVQTDRSGVEAPCRCPISDSDWIMAESTA